MNQWYYLRGQEPCGPVSLETLSHLVSIGTIHPSSLVWREGLSEWLPMGSLGLRSDSVPPPPPPVQTAGGPSPYDGIAPPSPPVQSAGMSAAASPIGTNRAAVAPKPSYSTAASSNYSQAASVRPRKQSSPARTILLVMVTAVAVFLAGAAGWIARAWSIRGRTTRPSIAAVTTKPEEETPVLPATRSKSDPVDDAREVRTSTTPNPHPKEDSSAIVPAETKKPDYWGTTQPRAPAKTDGPEAKAPVYTPPTRPASNPRGAAPTVGDPPGGAKEPGSKSGTPTEPATKPDSPATKTPASAPRTEAHVLFQEIDIGRTPKFMVLGTEMSQDLGYQILSELHVDAANDQGVRVVEQTIKDTRLLRSDALSQMQFAETLQALKGWQFSYQVNRIGSVKEIKSGPKDGRKAVAVEPKGSKGVLVTSVMDLDGWKEMAELSFFVPDHKVRPGAFWTRQMTHDYTPLGSWYGETQFRPTGTDDGAARYDFVHHLTYLPPKRDGGALPFAVKNANFQTELAEGSIYYDVNTARVRHAHERFVVRGLISSEIAGQAVGVEVEESQTISVRISDQNPWEKM